MNLLNNAAKFTATGRTGSGSRSIAPLEADGAGPQVVIRVRDTGIGISREAEGAHLRMFEQGRASPQQGGAGLGVGLTLVRSLVEMHGGTVEIRSEGREPRQRVHRAPARLPTRRGQCRAACNDRPGDEPTSHPSRKILLVDDNRDQAHSLGKLLELMGHDVRLAFDGEEALEVAAAFLPDVALMDSACRS